VTDLSVLQIIHDAPDLLNKYDDTKLKINCYDELQNMAKCPPNLEKFITENCGPRSAPHLPHAHQQQQHHVNTIIT